MTAGGEAPGTWIGWLPIFPDPSQVSGRTVRESRLLQIPRDAVRQLLDGGFPVATHLMAGLTWGVRNFEALARQQEKLAALGKLSAGLAHDLNNPAAAAGRAAELLGEAVARGDRLAQARSSRAWDGGGRADRRSSSRRGDVAAGRGRPRSAGAE